MLFLAYLHIQFLPQVPLQDDSNVHGFFSQSSSHQVNQLLINNMSQQVEEGLRDIPSSLYELTLAPNNNNNFDLVAYWPAGAADWADAWNGSISVYMFFPICSAN